MQEVIIGTKIACSMQNGFGMFEGEVVRIGLAKPNPHRDIVSWELK